MRSRACLPTPNGLTGAEIQHLAGADLRHRCPEPEYVMPVDPPHEFGDILEAVAGPGAVYTPGGAYPPINNTGYVAAYAPAAAAQRLAT